jgi:hypothetical protein
MTVGVPNAESVSSELATCAEGINVTTTNMRPVNAADAEPTMT